MNFTSDKHLEDATRKKGNFLIWVKDQDDVFYLGNSFDLCLSLANGKESIRVFPCYDTAGNFHQLHPSQIKDYGGNFE